MMQLTLSNYHSKESNQKYLSCSQYKSFYGTLGRPGCEAMTMAELNGSFTREKGIDLYIGQYVDNYFSGTLKQFKEDNPEIFCKTGKNTGELKSPFKNADELIKRAERDPLFMKYLSGAKQIIMTAELFGVKWKIAIDSYIRDTAIVDLKIMKSIRESFYVPGQARASFVEYWGYDMQLAIYQKIVELNTGTKLPCYIACLSKEKVADIELVGVDNDRLQMVLEDMSYNIEHIQNLKSGETEPERCEKCNYCKDTKVLKEVVHYKDLI